MAQMTAPESIVRAIKAGRPGPNRTLVLNVLGLSAVDDGPCTEQERANALAQLVSSSVDPLDIPDDDAPVLLGAATSDAPRPVDEEDLPF